MMVFDDFGKIRILSQKTLEASEKTRDESKEFIQSVSDFNENISALLNILHEKSRITQNAQMQALGYKSRVESEVERRTAKTAQLKTLSAEKQSELDRLIRQYDSLLKVSQEQSSFIEQLSLK